jgi:hypothetical protein
MTPEDRSLTSHGRDASSPQKPARNDESRPLACSLDEVQQFPACPVCGGRLIEIRQKRQCERCHTICETCCEGGRG